MKLESKEERKKILVKGNEDKKYDAMGKKDKWIYDEKKELFRKEKTKEIDREISVGNNKFKRK